jgi:hypothetical protein
LSILIWFRLWDLNKNWFKYFCLDSNVTKNLLKFLNWFWLVSHLEWLFHANEIYIFCFLNLLALYLKPHKYTNGSIIRKLCKQLTFFNCHICCLWVKPNTFWRFLQNVECLRCKLIWSLTRKLKNFKINNFTSTSWLANL